MKALLVSGDRSGSGKTSITLGIAALLARDRRVQTYKVGMDYIDPSYLAAASGRPCRNLDGFVMSPAELVSVFEYGAAGAEVGIVEGVRGLFEGAEALGDNGSTAEVAKALDLPVVLVVNARSITRSAAAVVKGFQAFDPAIRIKGVILNNVGGLSHREKATTAIEHYCGLPVIGAIPHRDEVGLAMRHLGLVPFLEGSGRGDFDERIGRLTAIIGEYCDLEALAGIAEEYQPRNPPSAICPPAADADVRIAVALDEAFNFYYAELFDLLRSQGAEIVPWSPVHDRLPDADGYIVGGGYPELYGAALEANSAARDALREVSRNGVPVYAECGGLMYLTERIIFSKGFQGRERTESFEMCGVFSGETRIPAKRIVAYVEGTATAASPFGAGRFRGHEFHYSEVALDRSTCYAYALSRGIGIADGRDGAVRDRTLASYLHLHPVPGRQFLERFVSAARLQ
jgi:cobyrinic acid a,c-diamide synthase